LSTIIEQQKSAKKYKIDQTVYSIVVLTTPYTINQITGEAIEDEVLIQDLDPQTLDGKKIKIAGHKQIFLNPHYRHEESTPQRIMDWLDLIYASIKTPNDYQINLKNKGIKRASELIDYEKLDADTITKMKISNETKALHSIIEHKAEQKGREEGRQEGLIETAKNGINAGFSNDIIQKMTGLTDKEIDALRKK
jgi:predicted transposase/invertase (TIGR01784 family)